MNKSLPYRILTYGIAMVWVINGFFCKVLDWAPRHTEIVANILGEDYAREITILIGVLEILLALWIITRIQVKWNVLLQILLVLSMNIIEFILVPDLLLWGKLNLVYALIFIGVIAIWGFYFKTEKQA